MIMGADTQLTRPCQHCQQDICAVHELLPHTPCSHRPSPLPRYHPLSSSSLSLHDSSSHCSWSKSSTRCPSPRTHHPRTCPIIKVHECPQSLHTLLCRRVLHNSDCLPLANQLRHQSNEPNHHRPRGILPDRQLHHFLVLLVGLLHLA